VGSVSGADAERLTSKIEQRLGIGCWCDLIVVFDWDEKKDF
jgi:hypothetical protein